MASTAYGVLYTASTTSAQASTELDDLLTPSIKFVRVQWVDLSNTVRLRILAVNHFRKLFSNPQSRPGINIGKAAALGHVGQEAAPNFNAVGEYLYVPDLSSWRVCTYAPGQASVMGWFQEKTPRPETGFKVPYCPRAILDRLVREAYDKAGVSFLVGVESEFVLLSATRPEPVYVSYGDCSVSSKTRTGSTESKVLEDIATCLLDAGIELQMYHAEAAPGQYEMVTGPLPPLQAADTLVFTRETIYNIANKHGFRATFSPKLQTDEPGSGAHAHISVHGGNTPERQADASRAPTLTPTERSFLQGLLSHLPAICALILPTAASYQRVADGIRSGGTYSCWGLDNRETPVRLCGPQGHHNFEVKTVDGTSTPHLALAGIISAGLEGILDGTLLEIGDCTKPAFEMNEQERKAVGLENPLRLPRTIADARKALVSDEIMVNMLGNEFVETYVAVNEILERFMTGKDEHETITKLIEYF